MKHGLAIALIMISANSFSAEYDSADSLRTFFTAPHVRHQLDDMRNAGKFSGTSNTSSTPRLRQPVKLKMQGIVIREQQKPVIFLNDGNTLKSRHINDEVIVSQKPVNNQSLRVAVKVNQQAIKLMPGQQWNESDKKIQDNYQIKPTNDKTSVAEKIQKTVNNLTN